jgi:hypothetical protein
MLQTLEGEKNWEKYINVYGEVLFMEMNEMII